MNQLFYNHFKKKTVHLPRKNIDATMQTFEIAVKEDIKNHEKRHLPYDNLTKKKREALKKLTERDDIVITRADKG